MTSFGTSPSQQPETHPSISYFNPTPVVVAIVPVRAINPASAVLEIGLLTVERGIEPQIGHIALPGGYLEYEDWRTGLLRELFEETSLKIDEPSSVTLQGAHSIDENRKLVLFGSVPPVDYSSLSDFVPNRECPRFEIIFEARELAFTTHTEMARNFFDSMRSPATLEDLSTLRMPK